MQGHELAIEGAKWVKDRLWTPDLLEKLNRARDARRSTEDQFAAQAQLTRDEEERTLKAATKAEKLENTLLAKLAKNKARKADIETAQQLFERESERAVIAEGELATQQVMYLASQLRK